MILYIECAVNKDRKLISTTFNHFFLFLYKCMCLYMFNTSRGIIKSVFIKYYYYYYY